MAMKAVIVDDERLARKRLRELLAAHPDVLVVGEADSVDTAERLIKECQPDVIFLDVEMPPQTGFDLLPLIADVPSAPEIVFVTAYENFALKAFDVSARDYLLKPIYPDRLAQALQKLKQGPTRNGNTEAASEETWAMDSKVLLNDRKMKSIVTVRDIIVIEALGAYSRVILRDQPAMMVLRSISEWEKRLPSTDFCRVDRSQIIQSRRVTQMKRLSRDETEITLQGLQDTITIGRTAAVRLRKQLNEAVE
jgi:Response regulator of the LytR/AlgR family